MILREYPHTATNTGDGDEVVFLKASEMPGKGSRADTGTGGSPVLLDFGARNPAVKNNVVVWSVWDDASDRDTIKLAVFQ